MSCAFGLVENLWETNTFAELLTVEPFSKNFSPEVVIS